MMHSWAGSDLQGLGAGESWSCSPLLTGTELCLRTWHWAPIGPVREGLGHPNIL